jgi:CPA2 family monovalent cation:H+ antiporter-2
MQLDFAIIIGNLSHILSFLPIIIFVKILIIYILASFSSKKRTAFKTALSLFQIGEFAIVIFELASVKLLIDNNLSQILVIMVIISMIITPFILNYITKITNFLSRYLSIDDYIYEESEVVWEIPNDIVLIGY